MSQPAAELLSAAFELHRAGRLAEAEPLYRQAVAAEPGRAEGWHLLGALCLQAGRNAEAAELIERAIALRGDNADFHSHLGAAYSNLGQHEVAVAALRRAVQLSPQSAMVHYNLGNALRNQGNPAEAVSSFERAIAIDPSSAEAHYNLGNALGELDRTVESEAAYRAALRARPNYVKAMINLGNVLHDRGQHAEAIKVFDAALAIEPAAANGHLNRGIALRDAGRYADAVAALSRAVTLDPQQAAAHNNLGTALQAQARFAEARACYDEALRLDPQLPEAHFTRASQRLREGDLARGFAEYEWRFRCRSYSRRQFAVPQWDGSPLAGRTILLHAEQGLGDTLQFVRYAAHVKERGGTVVVECQQPLLPLLQGVAGIDQLVAAGTPSPAHDVHCPLMSLPGVLGLSLDELWREPYLSPDPALAARWKAELPAGRGLRVGVCWQGNAKHLFDVQRSFPLALLADAARVPGVRLISLQKGQGREQIADCGFDVMDIGPQLDESAGAFVDTAAVVAGLDLVIACDTAVGHLAGALGRPVWVPLSAHSDWRWFLEREDSPWYPTMRLFRQRQLGQWPEVFERVASALAHRAGT